MAYANGKIPTNKLVWFTSGTEKFRSTPATAARWKGLVAETKALHNVTLLITSGPNAYRDIAQQTEMRAYYAAQGNPTQAAIPGTSSHGGNYSGAFTGWVTKDSMAIDVANWQLIGWAEFKRLANKHGFDVDVVIPHEAWHIVDFHPWTMPATSTTAAGGMAKPINNTTTKPNGDTPMRIIYNTDNSNEDTRRAIVGETSFDVITAGQSQSERKLWGDPVNVTDAEWRQFQLAIQRRYDRLAFNLGVPGAVRPK